MSQWFDGDRYHRRNVRRGDHDYYKASAYFVTVRTHNCTHLFGEARSGELCVNEAGAMLAREWHALQERFAVVTADEFVVMPDHVHGILIIGQDSEDSCLSLGRVMQAFKSITTRNYIEGARNNGWPEFDAKVWQRNYHERIIRNTEERDSFRHYIRENPGRWLEKHHDQ